MHKQKVCFFLLLLIVPVAGSARPHAETKIHVLGRSPLPSLQLGDHAAVFFSGERIRAAVQFYWGTSDGVSRAEGQPFALSDEWPNSVRWRIVDRGLHEVAPGGALRVTDTRSHRYPFSDLFGLIKDGEALTLKNVRVVASGELLTATVEVPALPPGIYRIEVEVAGTAADADTPGRSAGASFAVLRGDENSEVRRAYLYAELDRRTSKTSYQFEDVKPVLAELMSLSPQDFLVYDRAGDLSLGKADPQDTLAYYRRASALLNAGKTANGSVATFVARKKAKYAVFEKKYPVYAAHASEMTIEVVEVNAFVDFVMRRRGTGEPWRIPQ